MTGWEGPDGITCEQWEELRQLAATAGDADELSAKVNAKISTYNYSEEFSQTFPVFPFRLCTIFSNHPELRMVAHFENSPSVDGDVSLFVDGQTIFVAWRGTESKEDCVADAKFRKTSWTTSKKVLEKGKASLDGPRVHRGFITQYLGDGDTATDGSYKELDVQLNERVLQEVQRQIDLIKAAAGDEHPKNLEVHVCGHSLGGALTTLCTFELCQQEWMAGIPVTMVTLGSPRTGNKTFTNQLHAFVRSGQLVSYRLQNETDLVTNIPPLSFSYRHVGHHIWIRQGEVRKPVLKLGATPVLAMKNFVGFVATGGMADQRAVGNHSTDSYLRHLEAEPVERDLALITSGVNAPEQGATVHATQGWANASYTWHPVYGK